jgi:hypothetical protein
VRPERRLKTRSTGGQSDALPTIFLSDFLLNVLWAESDKPTASFFDPAVFFRTPHRARPLTLICLSATADLNHLYANKLQVLVKRRYATHLIFYLAIFPALKGRAKFRGRYAAQKVGSRAAALQSEDARAPDATPLSGLRGKPSR